MSQTVVSPALPETESHGPEDQAHCYEIADRTLPGAGLGGYSLPEDVRFVIKRGVGSRVQSVDGRWYIDYVGGAGANILGHAHPEVVAAVEAQVKNGLHFFGTLNHTAIALAEKLAGLIPCAERLAFTTTGSEATFYALRIARAYTGRQKVLKFEGAYHGNHDYAAFSLFPTKPANYPVAPADSGGVPEVLQPTVLVAPYNDPTAVERLVQEHKDDLAAIIVEGVQRIIFAKPEFLAGLRRLCDEAGIVLIFDEVVTGFRLALGGAQEYFGVLPDLATYGKIVGGGGPLGCVAGRAEILDCVNPGRRGRPDYAYINGTLHGNPIAAAAGLATLEVLERPGFYEALREKSDALTGALQEVLDRHGVPAIAAGRNSFWQLLFMAAEPVNQVDIMNSDTERMKRLDLELLRRGVYVLPGVRRFVSAVNTEQDVADTVAALDEACQALES
ncbi:MAG: aminotransferase class III-fold pyridoxal phosphate-dependent enzyme [Kiloniellales bacterium]